MPENKSGWRVVPDTNVVVAAKKSKSTTSPSDELINRWLNEEFVLLYSRDTQLEYIKKLREKGTQRSEIVLFIKNLLNLAERVEIRYYHVEYYPEDSEDVRFILCADNGQASHIVSYDPHLLDLQRKCTFKIVKPVPFLKELRAVLAIKQAK